jgi:DNA-binding MarR family transcriptional regulator
VGRVEDPAGRRGAETEGEFGPLYAVLEGATAVHHRLHAVLERLHRRGEKTAGELALLRELDRVGERTVPEMARARPVSRQYVQYLVNRLLEDGFVELVPNPSHKRSRLVRLTPSGRRFLYGVQRREVALLAEVGIDVPGEDLRRAAEVLHRLREVFAGEQVRRLLARPNEDGDQEGGA